MRSPIIGVMGPGAQATSADLEMAYETGKRIAEAGWILLTGGRNCGVMEAANRGAKSAGGLTVGVLPSSHLEDLSESVDIPILTDMGSARNNINVLSSAVVIACGMGAGTASEVALALKAGKPVVLLNSDQTSYEFFHHLAQHQIHSAHSPEAAIAITRQLLKIHQD